MPAITTIIIAKNEAANIERAIRSVLAISEEVLVIDSGSTDATVKLAKAAGATVIQTHWRGYGPQKNWAALQANYPWILSLDADEEPDSALLEAIVEAPFRENQCYGFRRITNFCGHWVRHGAWGNDIVWRLYHRDAARWDERPVHENLIRSSSITSTTLDGELLHYSYPTLESHDEKLQPYLTLSAQSLFEAGKRSTFLKRNIAPFWRAFRTLILKQGYRDGWAGRELARRDYRMVKEKYQLLDEYWRNHDAATS